MTTVNEKRSSLNARQKYLVISYLIENAPSLRVVRSPEERARIISDATGVPLTVPNVRNAAIAAGVNISPRKTSEKKASHGAAVDARLDAIEKRLAILEGAGQ